MEYVKRNYSVNKRVQMRKHFKNTEVPVKLYYTEAQVKLPKKRKLILDLFPSPKGHFHNPGTMREFGNFIPGRCGASSGLQSASLSLLLTLASEFLSLCFLFSQMRLCCQSSDWQP